MTAPFDTLRFLAVEPIPETLQQLVRRSGSGLDDVLPQQSPGSGLVREEMIRRNLVTVPDGRVSTRGRACFYCIEGIEGVDLVQVVDNLRTLDPALSRVSLVREGMTTNFVDYLHRADPIRRVMICSPWMNLDRSRLRRFIQAIELSERMRGFRPEITVVTRPISDQPDEEQNQTLGYLNRIGAVITYQPRVHSKLYIVEAGEEIIQRFAFVGSENFTKVRYQELGIFVKNDNQLIDDLTRYFLSMAGLS